MSDFLTCRRLYDFRHNKGHKPKKPETALQFGGAMGKALDHWFATKDVLGAIQAFRGAFQEDLTVDDKRTYALGEWILRNYDVTYRDQPMTLLHTEMTFCLPLPNGNFLIGRVDKVVDWAGIIAGMDHKTTWELGPKFFNFAEPNLQFPGYTWALRQQGIDCKEFIVDAILVAKGLLPGKTKNNNLTALSRYNIFYKPEQIAEWLQAVLAIQADIRRCEETDTWYPNFTACVTKYGDCPYRRVCKEESEIRDRILKQDYTIEFWNPLATH